MTSLFFIMLVLFVVTIGYLQFQKKATEEQLEKIKELQTAVKQLPAEYFSYQPQYKRFKLNREIGFAPLSSTINPNDSDYLIEVGNSIKSLVDSLNSNDKYKGFDIKYQVVIEGMASLDSYTGNFVLSYERALSLYTLWKKNNIIFDPEFCEIQIAGSGIDGVREYSGAAESRNQQILIHIVPKMGKIFDEE
jgi:outer membrane protein OmpA-like peptidoglycan-associated protein